MSMCGPRGDSDVALQFAAEQRLFVKHTCGTVTDLPSSLMVVSRLGSGSRRPRATTLS